MQEVYLDRVVAAAVEPGAELRQRVDLGLDAAPVVAAGPVVAELAGVVQRHALRPAG
jgi:hypothetical protein